MLSEFVDGNLTTHNHLFLAQRTEINDYRKRKVIDFRIVSFSTTTTKRSKYAVRCFLINHYTPNKIIKNIKMQMTTENERDRGQ